MALVVCCPCGSPVDCDNVELVVTLTCPRCGREILLELETGEGRNPRAILTVMQGPHWVGEQFVVPVGVDLLIGTAVENWLALESEDMAEVHCCLHLTKGGRVSIEDRGSETGTWIGDHRIQQGRLGLQESFRIGEFRFRLDFQSVDGSGAPPPEVPADAEARPLPALSRVQPLATPGNWLIRHRFHVGRSLMIALAWLMSFHHACRLQLRTSEAWPGPAACLVGLIILAVLTVSGHRVTLAHRRLKYASVFVLVLLFCVDVNWSMPLSAVASLLLAVCLMILIIRVPSQVSAVFASLVGLAAVTVMAVLAAQSLIAIATDRL